MLYTIKVMYKNKFDSFSYIKTVYFNIIFKIYSINKTPSENELFLVNLNKIYFTSNIYKYISNLHRIKTNLISDRVFN